MLNIIEGKEQRPKKIVIYGPNKVLINGGAGELQGVVQGHCICPFTSQPHIMISETVESSP